MARLGVRYVLDYATRVKATTMQCISRATAIWSVRLARDGLSTVGSHTKPLSAGAPWEGGLIEAPSMVTDGSHHVLSSSGNAWDSEKYGIGYAECATVTGPCRKRTVDGPWMGRGWAPRPSPADRADRSSSRRWATCGWCTTAGPEDRRATLAPNGGSTWTWWSSATAVRTRVGGRRTATVFEIGGAVVLASTGALVWWWRRRRRAGLRTDERA